MSRILFKMISFALAFIFSQGVILPWAISNNDLPLWADIILVTIILMTWIAIIDRIAFRLIKILRKNNELPESD
jgi:uncharacterized membrane protein YbhN (UPF0104 family)